MRGVLNGWYRTGRTEICRVHGAVVAPALGTREAESKGKKSSKTAENLHGLTLPGHSGLFLYAQPETAKENDIVGQTGLGSQTRPGGEKLYSLAPELREKSEHGIGKV